MTAYVDTSAFLRLVLREPGALTDLRTYTALVSSELIAVESLRTIDRLRHVQNVLFASDRRTTTTRLTIPTFPCPTTSRHSL